MQLVRGHIVMIMIETSASARFFFNFISDAQAIRDKTGVDLSIEGDVVGQIACALEDLYRESCLGSAEWDGWRIEVADCIGRTVLSITLGASIQEDSNFCSIPRDFKSCASTRMVRSARSAS
jgi:hypothetical protein